VTPARRLLTPRWIAFTLFVAAAATAFLFMAWWQLIRFESSSGSWQNLGYTLQWPFFAAFAVYVWWKLLRDTGQPAEAEAGSETLADAGGVEVDMAAARTGAAEGQAVPAEVAATTERSRLDDRPDNQPDDQDDPELAAYNAYLAALHRRDQQHAQETA
jgi:DNA-binding transcriptional regulator of glucitol operon